MTLLGGGGITGVESQGDYFHCSVLVNDDGGEDHIHRHFIVLSSLRYYSIDFFKATL